VFKFELKFEFEKEMKQKIKRKREETLPGPSVPILAHLLLLSRAAHLRPLFLFLFHCVTARWGHRVRSITHLRS
jgi:hypothetical protein